MKTAKIIVCCHKRDVMAAQDPYLPVHVGKALSNLELGIQAGNDGENISTKNRSYCELTGMYWVWKNLHNIDVVGLCHYRRYFDFHNQCDGVLPDTTFKTADFDKTDLSIPAEIIEQMHNGEAYVAKPRYFRQSVYMNYCLAHISDDIRTLERHIMTTQPENICQAWFEYMHGGCQLRHYNMFIMTWADFDRYCSWLFPLLEEMEHQIDIKHYSPVQGRIFGYMAERLMNVWLLANKFILHERPVVWFNDNPCGASRNHLTYYRNLLRSKLAIAITRGEYKNFRKTWGNRVDTNQHQVEYDKL